MKRGAPLRRRTRLAPGAGPKRKTPMKRFNPKRRARLYERNFGDHSDWIRSLPCAAPPPHRGRIEAAHVTGTRGMGGCGADKSALAPLCTWHHLEQERSTDRFDARYGTNLRALAAQLWARSPTRSAA